MSITNRSNKEKTLSHGQFLTSIDIAKRCIDLVGLSEDLIIEPSCGNGSFLKEINHPNVLGVELDNNLLSEYQGEHNVICKNFYDFDINLLRGARSVHFIGNPPFRSPALSLQTHYGEIDRLRRKYSVESIREEACLFILKTFDLLQEVGQGRISYILPEAIFKNNSTTFRKFIDFIRNNLTTEKIMDIDSFPGVSRKLVFISWTTDKDKTDSYFDYYGVDDDIIPFQQIFKKTYLGSVPCESIFLSCKGEPLEHFIKRTTELFTKETNEDNVVERLSYNGKPHLKSLQNGNYSKVPTIVSYVQEIQGLPEYSADKFEDRNNYQIIQHRQEERWYFRHNFLKRGKRYVYQLNPNPCESFYFPGNPSSTSSDYFGYCRYDVNRNSSPGALRIVPIKNLEDNIQEGFLEHWNSRIGGPITRIFEYMIDISRSSWYKEYKKRNHRFYFGVPREEP